MNIRPRMPLLLPLLALSLTFAMVASVHAQDRQHQGGTSATLRVSFGTTPHWVDLPGTRVRAIRQGERPDYDMFQYGGNYYAYNNNRWYMSPREDGDFALIDDRSVPSDFSSIPREHWRNYPAQWRDRQHQGPGGTSATLRVSFGTRPRWMGIPGTRVRAIRQGERPDYDMFQYGGNYYAYSNDRWYMSRRESGDFALIDDRSVPSEFSSIPREHWRNYPAQWQDRQHQGPGGTSATLQFNFGTRPRWMGIPGTRVRAIRQGGGSDYDVFQYGRNYYLYDGHQWYMSRRWGTQFIAIDDRFVPGELLRVPRRHWRNYPSGWSDQNSDPRYDRDGRRH